MKKKEEKKKALTTEKFMNSLLDYCAYCSITDWSDRNPKKDFKELGILIILFMSVRGWKIK